MIYTMKFVVLITDTESQYNNNIISSSWYINNLDSDFLSQDVYIYPFTEMIFRTLHNLVYKNLKLRVFLVDPLYFFYVSKLVKRSLKLSQQHLLPCPLFTYIR